MFPRRSHRCRHVLYCLRADRFGAHYAAHIVKDVSQTLLKILDYPHRCHILSFRHSSRYLLKKHLPNYRYLHELPHQFYWGICVAQYFSSTAYVTTSCYCFYRKWNFSWKYRFSPKISRIGQNEFQIRLLRHFLHSIRKTCIFGFTCPLRNSLTFTVDFVGTKIVYRFGSYF